MLFLLVPYCIKPIKKEINKKERKKRYVEKRVTASINQVHDAKRFKSTIRCLSSLTRKALEQFANKVAEVQFDVAHSWCLLIGFILEVQPGAIDVLDECGMQRLCLSIQYCWATKTD